MKLVELLVKELFRWPEGVTYFVQDDDGEVKAGIGSEPREPATGIWLRRIPLDNYNFYPDLCTDWKTSIVTKDVYTKHKTQMKQDFRNTKIHIKSEEHSKAFQEAVFEAGGRHDPADVRTDAEYIYVDSNLVLTGGVVLDTFEVSPHKEIDFPTPTKGHIHAELMSRYAEDAKSHAEPWKLWEVKTGSLHWIVCQFSPSWDPCLEYRRKPKTHIVNGVEIPDLRVSLKSGDNFYLANPTSPELTTLYRFDGDIKDEIWVERGLTYQPTEEGKQASILHSKAMLEM